ncbi:MAG: glycosyltransferase family 4 protein [Thermanaerothrix sp.]|uniref:glycosyltransferase family 4 protein n=1 Tax=Thermanaerothrix sp. TaxID=2972675 RepID=UPI003C7BAA76
MKPYISVKKISLLGMVKFFQGCPRMKVLIVTTAFPRWYGDGRGAFIYEAAQAIKRQGCEVRVIAMHVPGAKTHEWMDGIEVIRPRYLPERWEILAKDSAGLPQAWRTNPWAKLALIPFVVVHALTITRYAREADILHANWTLSGMVVWLTQWLHRKPYVVTVHGSDVFQATSSGLIRKLTWFILSSHRTAQIIAVSRKLAESLIQMGVPSEKIKIIPDGVRTDEFIPSEEPRKKVILSVGALTKIKGGDLLIEAFAQIHTYLEGYKLIFIGEGAFRECLESRVKELGLRDKVIFTGQLSRQEVAYWMREAEIFVLPSRSEGLGVVFLEALASGTPCIGTDVGGIPDILTPEVGILCPPEDPTSLAEAILFLLNNPVHLQEMRKKARKRAVEVFDWARVSQQIIRLYSQILGVKV